MSKLSRSRLISVAKSLAYRTGLGQSSLFHLYPYMFEPAQLAFLLGCLDDTRDVAGSVVEVGCAYGHTTVFLNKHLLDAQIDKRYVCIDTFAGFTERDVVHEIRRRGKANHEHTYRSTFRENKLEWVARTLAHNEVGRVELIEADASTFEYSDIAPISFALVDVDLYLPVRAALDAIYPALAPGGVVVIDDCRQHTDVWDGAAQAYGEFAEEHGLPHRIVQGKLGVIKNVGR